MRNRDEGAKAYVEPVRRGLEIGPELYRGLTRVARAKNVDVNDLVSQLVWEYLRQESEKEVAKHEYPNEDRIPLRCLL